MDGNPRMPMMQILVAAMIVLTILTGCKKEKAAGQAPEGSGFLPSEGRYTYEAISTDGTTAEDVDTVFNLRDTAGGKAVTVHSGVGTSLFENIIFRDDKQTVTSMTPPSSFFSFEAMIKAQPNVVDFEHSGWPMFQQLPNNPVMGDELTFSGGPINMHWVIKDPDEPPVTGDFTVEYIDGTLVKTGESVATPAGTFNCSVWAYGRTTTLVSGLINQVRSFADTVYMTPGIGPVKTTESVEGVYTVTELTKIN